jgi:hypothetical protein
MRKLQIPLLKTLLFFIVLMANIFQLQAFTFNMYSGRGTEVMIIVANKQNQIIHTRDLFQKEFSKGFLFLSTITAQEFCRIAGANKVSLSVEGFKAYDC